MQREDYQPIKTPMSALIDVVFLLLIYFVVTHTNLYEQNQEVSQKGNGPASLVDKSGFLTVLVAPDSYQLPDARRSMTLAEIQAYLRTQLSFDPEFGVAVSVAGNAEHNRVIALLDSCREVEVARFRMLGLARD
jgi:biopolymer transport protein ExbD